MAGAGAGYGRNPYGAIQSLRSALQRAISCVTPSVLTARSAGGYGPDSEHLLTLGSGEPVRMAGIAEVSLWLRHFARVAEHEGLQGPWRADTTGYYYSILDGEGREVIAYHWHPGRRSPINFPHLHLGSGSGVSRNELQKAHIPTGRVELEDVLAMAIREFGVRPRRDDWAEILGT